MEIAIAIGAALAVGCSWLGRSLLSISRGENSFDQREQSCGRHIADTQPQIYKMPTPPV